MWIYASFSEIAVNFENVDLLTIFGSALIISSYWVPKGLSSFNLLNTKTLFFGIFWNTTKLRFSVNTVLELVFNKYRYCVDKSSNFDS